MPRYARETTVSPEKTREEIELTLRRYNADEFHSGWKAGAAMIAFRLDSLFIRFVLPIPAKTEKRFREKIVRGGYVKRLTQLQTDRAHEQEVRQRWRALLLVIKAKLEAVECGISSLQNEFLANIVLPNDATMGEWLANDFIPQIRAGEMPRLSLPAPKPEAQDAEFEVKP